MTTSKGPKDRQPCVHRCHQARLLSAATLLAALLLALPAQTQPLPAEQFIAATHSLDSTTLRALSDTVDAAPLALARELRTGLGGHKAWQRYAAAMLDNGQAEALGRQWAALFVEPRILAKGEEKDGSFWYPVARDAGFLTGGIAAALNDRQQQLPAFALGAQRHAPAAQQSLFEWLAQAAKGLPRPARTAFNQAMRAAAVL